MKFIMVPVLLSVAFIGFEHKDAAIDLYRAAYPADPAKREALERCARIDPNFNRLDASDRDTCYTAVAPRVAVSSEPASGIYYAINPSHLPSNDIRRQEANAAYGVARTTKLVVPAVAHQALRNSQNP